MTANMLQTLQFSEKYATKMIQVTANMLQMVYFEHAIWKLQILVLQMLKHNFKWFEMITICFKCAANMLQMYQLNMQSSSTACASNASKQTQKIALHITRDNCKNASTTVQQEACCKSVSSDCR